MIKAILNNKVFKNFSYLTLGSMLSQVIGVFTIIKITALLSPNNYGLYTFIMSQGTLLFIIADFGITNIIVRAIARDRFRTNDLVFNGAIIRFFSVLILAVFYSVYNFFLGNLTSVQVLLVFSYPLINCFAHLFEIAFLGNQKMLPTSVINLAYSVVWFVAVYAMPDSYINVVSLFSLFLALNIIKAVVSLIVLKTQKLLVGQVQNFWVSCKGLVAESWPYFSLVLIMLPVNYLSNNFLVLNSKIVEVGYFSLSQKLMSPVELVLGFALSAIFPNISSLWAKDENRFNRLVSIGFKYFMLVALILCFLFTLFIKEVVVLFFKASYLPAVKVCQLHIWFVFLMAIFSLIGTILGAVNKEKMIFKFGVINALISTPMLYYGSKYGALGLSYAYLISFALFAFYCWPTFKKIINIQVKDDWLMWILSALLFSISYYIPPDHTLILRLVVSVVVLGAAALYISKNRLILQT